MATRVVLPDTVTIPISNDDWILIKKRLNAGEIRAARARRYEKGPDGYLHINPLTVETTLVLAFLVDWSLTQPDGHPLRILGEPLAVVAAALDAIDGDSFDEIYQAISAHERALETARTQEKKNDPDWRARIVTDLVICQRFGWKYEWVAQLDPDVYYVLVDELTKAKEKEQAEQT